MKNLFLLLWLIFWVGSALSADYNYAVAGQSNGYRYTHDDVYGGGTDYTPNASLSYYTGSWAAPSGNQANSGITFGNTIIEATGKSVGILNYCVDGTALVTNPYGQKWSDRGAGTLYQNLVNAINTVGGVEAVLWVQGESDAYFETTKEAYKAALIDLIGDVRTDTGDSTMPFIISILGRETGTTLGTNATWNGIIEALYEVSLETAYCYIGATNRDNGIGTADVHWTDASYTTHGRRMAQAALYLLGQASYYRGPYPSSFTKIDATHVDVTISYGTGCAGTDFTPTTGITGFAVTEDGNSRAISAAVRQSASTVRLTTATLGNGTLAVTYQYGKNPDISGAIKDNTVLALPMEEYFQDPPPTSVSPPSISGGAVVHGNVQ